MTQHPFADAVWKALKGDHNDLRRQAIILEAHREALAQYEKSDTDEKAIRLDERKKIIAGGCHHTRAASERVETRPDLEEWQTSQSEWFDATILEIVSEYAEWRDKQQSDTDRDQLRDALAAAYSQGATDVHKVWSSESDPDFGEAASDYASHAIAALASKTAIDPATVEDQCQRLDALAANMTANWDGELDGYAGTISSVARAIRALGKDQ